MPTRSHPLTWALGALCLVLCVLGCAGDEGGLEGVPEGVRFEPAPGRLNADALEGIEFRVLDPSGDPIVAVFRVQGDVVAESTSYLWPADTLGETIIVATSTFAGTEYRGEWTVVVSDDGELPSPRVTAIVVGSGDIPGSIQVEWDAPGRSTYSIEPSSFEVGYATSGFDGPGFDSVARVEVPWNREAITQYARLEGLLEQVDYQVRIRTRDRIDRVSALSPQVQARATGHFNLEGRVGVLEPQLPYRAQGGVLVDWNGIKTVTEPDGSFALPNLADTLELPVLVRDGSGLDYYGMLVGPLVPIDQSIEVTLLPREFVAVQEEVGVVQWRMLDWLVKMTNNERAAAGTAMELRRWETYPVQVYVAPYTIEGVNGPVDYYAAFVRGAELWNAAATVELLEIVDAPVEVGATGAPVSSDLLGSNIAFTQMVRPAGGLYETWPQFIGVAIRDNLNSQELADRVIAHELGHVLLLPHSPHLGHLMANGAPSVSRGEPSREEAFVARVVAQMPPGTMLNWVVDPDN